MSEYNEENIEGTRTNIPYRNSSARTDTCEEMTIL